MFVFVYSHEKKSFRGFGSPQILAITETMVTEIVEQLGMDQTLIRSQNFYKENEKTIYDVPLTDWHLPEMFTQLATEFDMDSKRREVEKFNTENKWKKRGLSIVPSNYGLGFGVKFLEQGAALCHIYTDGSVLIHTAGVEIGQGLHTKLIHLAANTLQIPENQIYINETSTSTIPNGIPTVASLSTDLQGSAVLNACQILSDHLKPYRERNPNGNLASWASSAFIDRVSLSTTGYFIIKKNRQKQN